MKLTIILLIQGLMVWAMLITMNETENGKFPNRKILGISMIVSYIFSFTVNQIAVAIDIEKVPYIKWLSIPLILFSLTMCCIMFTGGVTKILISILITDLYGALTQPMITFLYCVIKNKELRFMYSGRNGEDIVLEIILEVIVDGTMFLIAVPLFRRYRKFVLLEAKWCAVFIIFYFVMSNVWSVKPVRIVNRGIYPYYYNLIFVACFSSMLILLLGYNQKKTLDMKLQSLYLKQKMEQEYGLVFEDMDKNVRRFRHDIRKHMDTLSYLEKNYGSDVSAAQLAEYQRDLKAIYTELTYGNYCCKYDVNMVLMQLEKDCWNLYPEKNMEMSVSLKNLNLDSLPVYIRVQLFEQMSQWIKERLDQSFRNKEDEKDKRNNKAVLLFTGDSSSGFHTLKISLFCPSICSSEVYPSEKERNCEKFEAMRIEKTGMKSIKKHILNKRITAKINRLLYGYNPSVKVDFAKPHVPQAEYQQYRKAVNAHLISPNLVVCWHDKK